MELPAEPGAVFAVRVHPSATRTRLVRYDGAREEFVFDVAAVADKGKANAELLSHLKKSYGLACEIVSGATSRKKLLRVRNR